VRGFLGPFDFLLDMPNSIIPERFPRIRRLANLAWRIILVVATVYVGIAAIYYEYFLWSVER
jgi:hypothetical protein